MYAYKSILHEFEVRVRLRQFLLLVFWIIILPRKQARGDR